MSNEVQLDFGGPSRNRGGAFGFKRSRTKHLKLNSHKLLTARDLKHNNKKLQKNAKKVHNSEKLK
jgi:hypothetical protein